MSEHIEKKSVYFSIFLALMVGRERNSMGLA